MVFAAAAVAIFGMILKLIAVEPAGWFLVPLAAVACIYHVRIHAIAARAPVPPIGLAAVSDLLLLAAILLQIDFGWTYNCGHTTYNGVAWNLGWSSERICTLTRGLPAFVLDLSYYIPVAVTWRRLRHFNSANHLSKS
jgi:hypothetical protein